MRLRLEPICHRRVISRRAHGADEIAAPNLKMSEEKAVDPERASERRPIREGQVTGDEQPRFVDKTRQPAAIGQPFRGKPGSRHGSQA